MIKGQFRGALAPAFLLVALLLGGSSLAAGRNLVLHWLGIAALAWAALQPGPHPSDRAMRPLAWLLAAYFLLVLAQLVPLPPALWSALPGRGFVAHDLATLGLALPWRSLSLDPEATIAGALAMLPPAGMMALVARAGPPRDGWLVGALIAGALVCVMLGLRQLTSGGPYLFAFSSVGAAAGLFANSNHMATLLLVAIPYLVGWAAGRWRSAAAPKDRTTLAAGAAAVLLVLLVGLAVNGSIAGIILAVPVAGLSALLVLPAQGHRMGRLLPIMALLLLAAAIIAVVVIGPHPTGVDRSSISVRRDIWSATLVPFKQYWLVGSGLGTFQEVFRHYENAETVTRYYANHAHNDVLEWLLETGMAGLVVLAALIAFWARRSITLWQTGRAGPLARPASIACAAVMLHSLVDFPLRSPAIAVVFAMSLALMAEAERKVRTVRETTERRPARHLDLRSTTG